MSLIINIILAVITVILLILWLRARKLANDVEIVAYGLRSVDDQDDNTKTSITLMEAEFDDALEKLVELGEIEQDNWGKWVWTKTGEPLGHQED